MRLYSESGTIGTLYAEFLIVPFYSFLFVKWDEWDEKHVSHFNCQIWQLELTWFFEFVQEIWQIWHYSRVRFACVSFGYQCNILPFSHVTFSLILVVKCYKLHGLFIILPCNILKKWDKKRHKTPYILRQMAVSHFYIKNLTFVRGMRQMRHRKAMF